MSTSSGSLSFDAARESMDVLARQLDAFVEAWESTTAPPDLKPFLPGAGEIRRLTLVELIKVDLEYRWLSRDCPKRISEYFTEFPELVAGPHSLRSDLRRIPYSQAERSGGRRRGVSARVSGPLRPKSRRSSISSRLTKRPPSSVGRSSSGSRRSAAGDTIDDFELLSELGAGAFAKVFLARQKSMQRTLAVKISADEGTEPQTLAQLDHDHIVRVFDQRTLPDRKLRLLYMQYIAGGTLQQVIKRVRQTPPRSGRGKSFWTSWTRVSKNEAMRVPRCLRRGTGWQPPVGPKPFVGSARRLARGLDYAHRRGVLHRDVKPANVLLTAEPSPKLADFNISFSSKVAGATPAAYFGGSLAYMSPEQLEACNPAHTRSAEDLDGRSDLYSLGVLLWELLTGSRPFSEENIGGGWSAILETMVERRETGVDRRQSGPSQRLPQRIGFRARSRPRARSRATLVARVGNRPAPRTVHRSQGGSAAVSARNRALGSGCAAYLVRIVLLLAGLPNIVASAFHYLAQRVASLRRVCRRISIASSSEPKRQSVQSPLPSAPSVLSYLELHASIAA